MYSLCSSFFLLLFPVQQGGKRAVILLRMFFLCHFDLFKSQQRVKLPVVSFRQARQMLLHGLCVAALNGSGQR